MRLGIGGGRMGLGGLLIISSVCGIALEGEPHKDRCIGSRR